MKARGCKVLHIFLVASLLLLTAVQSAQAAGLALYETGAPDLGTASAGRAAMAADASTVATNPAGMTLLDRTQLMITSGAMLPAINFDRGSQTKVPGGGGGGGNAGVFFPLGALFYAHKLNDRLWLGVAVDSNFGLSADYSLTWAGRYYATKESILTGQVNPNIAYRVNEWLSVGAGFSFSVARFTTQAKINNLLPRLGDGGLAIESWDEAFGGNIGFLLQPTSKLRIGLTYNSPVDFKFGFHPDITNLGPGLRAALKQSGLLGAKVNLGMTEPQQMMASALYQLTPALALMGNIGWQNWSQFGQTTLGISAETQKSLAVDLNYSDTIQIAFGGQYRLANQWLLSAGFAYDSSPVSEANRTPSLPLDRQLRYGTGVQYQVNNDLIVGIANEVFDGSNAPYDVNRGPLAGRLQGDFSSNIIDFLGINLVWKLGPSEQ
ncbi:MAG: OmpP1/FadL family transporter [Candidatus Binataceae bacterium]